ncbi:GNAT family N-acetyltransferase [Asanoa iriomotensis]|uniref:GNAT family N-acetyltransferase n=1 Tax=Asanoa iriomotensis TaxID=234613 RepID=UPI001EF26607|nr:GNAT family N-acetyltransferase [Asanoa iriomotensis]
MEARLVVRECGERDVDALERQLPTGLNHYHAARYRRQCEGFSTFLVAYRGEVVVGSGEILWQGAKEPEVRERFPDCPEINGLAVVPDHQSQGVGTAIIRAAEELAARRGAQRIGMGVGGDNDRAEALYLRLGYADTGCRYLDRYQNVDAAGKRHDIADPCRFLVKPLTPAR